MCGIFTYIDPWNHPNVASLAIRVLFICCYYFEFAVPAAILFDFTYPCILTRRIRQGRRGGGVGDQVLTWDPWLD